MSANMEEIVALAVSAERALVVVNWRRLPSLNMELQARRDWRQKVDIIPLDDDEALFCEDETGHRKLTATYLAVQTYILEEGPFELVIFDARKP